MLEDFAGLAFVGRGDMRAETDRLALKAVGDDIPVQLGGGIRDLDTIERYLDDGISYVIIGTAAVKNPGFLDPIKPALILPEVTDKDARQQGMSVVGYIYNQVGEYDLSLA